MKTFTNVTKNHTKIRGSRSCSVRALGVFLGSMFPVLAQAEVLQDTFGNGYGVMHKQAVSKTVSEVKRIESAPKSAVFQHTFGDGYVFVHRRTETLMSNSISVSTVDRPRTFTRSSRNETRVSAFDALLKDGYGVLVSSTQSLSPQLFTYECHQQGGSS